MKSRIFILAAALLVLTTFSPGKAKAWSLFPPIVPIIPIIPIIPIVPFNPFAPVTPPKTTTTLPIDSGLVLLMISGIAMGVAAVKKSNAAIKAATVKA